MRHIARVSYRILSLGGGETGWQQDESSQQVIMLKWIVLMSKVCSEVFFPGITVWSHGCLTADHQAHGAVWFQHSHAPPWHPGQSLVRASVPSYHRLTQLSQPRMLWQHFAKIIEGLMGEMWQILHFRVSWSRPRSLRGTGVSFVTSNTRSIFLWRRAISSEKSFSTSTQLLDWWLSWSSIHDRLFVLSCAQGPKDPHLAQHKTFLSWPSRTSCLQAHRQIYCKYGKPIQQNHAVLHMLMTTFLGQTLSARGILNF